MARPVTPCLAVIPARGGSKGLPGKNIRILAGLPLLGHSVRCAQSTPAITRTVVSTDSPQIAAVAREQGADVPFLRPPELARDDTPMMPVIAHALAELEAQEGRRYESVILLDPTSPGRLPSDIDSALRMLSEDDGADGVVACSQPHFNPLWVGVFERAGYLEPAFVAGATFQRRQDVPRFFRINGALYVWRSDFVRPSPADWRATGRHRMLEIPEQRAFSIDNQEEFTLLELVLEHGIVKLPWLKKGS
ncbi:MAG: acylneuraminate cytidylyltransferase family protein [Myxococcales bacterium]